MHTTIMKRGGCLVKIVGQLNIFPSSLLPCPFLIGPTSNCQLGDKTKAAKSLGVRSVYRVKFVQSCSYNVHVYADV